MATANQTPSGAVLKPEQFSYIEAKQADVQNIVTDSITVAGGGLSVSGCGFEVPAGYTTIQAAVDAAQAEATSSGQPQSVRICNGTFVENVVITGPISLIGQGINTVIIGSVDIQGDISGFSASQIGPNISNLTIVSQGTTPCLTLSQIAIPGIGRYVITHSFLLSPANAAYCLNYATSNSLHIYDTQFVSTLAGAITSTGDSLIVSSCTFTGAQDGSKPIVPLFNLQGPTGIGHFFSDCFVIARVYGGAANAHVLVNDTNVRFTACLFQLGDSDEPFANVAHGFNVTGTSGSLQLYGCVIAQLEGTGFVSGTIFAVTGTAGNSYVDGGNNSYLGLLPGFQQDIFTNAGGGTLNYILASNAPTQI